MSLKWYPNARLDETQEAYGKTWRVDKIENDGAIVFRCGSETALAPRTDSPERVYQKVLHPVGLGYNDGTVDMTDLRPKGVKIHSVGDGSGWKPIDFTWSASTKNDCARRAENRRRQAESADKMQKAMSEALAGVGAKLLVHDCYTCDVDMKDVDDRIKSFIGGMAPKPDIPYKALEEYTVYKGWAEKGWNGI